MDSIEKPYFNESTTIEMLSPGLTGPQGTRLRFKITDLDGLHQAQLVSTIGYENAFELSILDCKPLDGSSTIEFATDRLTPKTDSVILRVIDVFGNFTEAKFPVNHPPTENVNTDGPIDIQN